LAAITQEEPFSCDWFHCADGAERLAFSCKSAMELFNGLGVSGYPTEWLADPEPLVDDPSRARAFAIRF